MRRLILALCLMGCRGGDTKPESPDVVQRPVPEAAAPDAPMTGSTGRGWMYEGAQTSPTNVDRAQALEAIRKAPARAIVVYEETIEECSSMGGSHVFFEMDPKGVAHFGGHGAMLHAGFAKGDVWVAGITPLAKPESVGNPMWCVPDRMIDARVVALVPVASRDEGARLLQELSK